MSATGPDLNLSDLSPDSCNDGSRDLLETDIDCGGPECNACGDGRVCKVDSDCTNGNCRAGVCRPAITCKDGMKDVLEIDVDCGGPDCACAHCAVGKSCSVDNDCQSGLCKKARCVAPTPLTLAFSQAATDPLGTGPRNIAVGDLNGDGNLDLAGAADHGPVRVYLGVGDGTFTAGASIATDNGYDICTADFNRDGHLDLAVSLGDVLGVAVFLGVRNGTFTGALITPTPNADSTLWWTM